MPVPRPTASPGRVRGFRTEPVARSPPEWTGIRPIAAGGVADAPENIGGAHGVMGHAATFSEDQGADHRRHEMVVDGVFVDDGVRIIHRIHHARHQRPLIDQRVGLRPSVQVMTPPSIRWTRPGLSMLRNVLTQIKARRRRNESGRKDRMPRRF